jgi:hypothetical protein
MMIGSPSVFAIESEIAKAYALLGLRALVFFVIHAGGRSYGVRKPDATMLANSFDEVRERIACRGKHTGPFATELDAGKIADAFRNSIFAEEQEESYFGIPLADFRKLFHSAESTKRERRRTRTEMVEPVEPIEPIVPGAA